MGDVVEFHCKECGEPAAIGNMDYLTGITGLTVEELKYCDSHLSKALEGVVLDLSIGSSHTRSAEFRARRDQRKRDREKGEEVAAAKKTSVIRFGESFFDDRIPKHESQPYGETIEVVMPKLAKEDLKELGWTATYRRWDQERGVWLVDADRVGMVRDHMESKGWMVE